jgi:hypothetical protein
MASSATCSASSTSASERAPDARVKPLAVGLLVEGVLADRYVAELARWIQGEPRLRLALIVAPGPAPRANPLWRAVAAVEKLLVKSDEWHRDHYAVHDLRAIVDRSVTIVPGPYVEQLKALRLDLLVSFSDVPRDLLGVSRLGAISVHEDGFWACYHRRHQTRFVIRRLGCASGEDEVLASGAFRTRFFSALNQANVRKKAVAHVKRLLGKTGATGALPPPRAAAAAQPADAGRRPDSLECLTYACKLAARIALRAPCHTPFFGERFGVSVVAGPWNEALPWQSAAGRLPRGRYWADPFVYAHGGRTFCFIEDLDRRTQRAHITVLEVKGAQLVELGVALREPFHLSFPFLFEHRGELYMCPESSAAGEIRLYRCTDFPLGWRFEKTLMRNVSAADTMLFERAGRWWMLTNIDESQTGDHCSELYLFSAASPLSDDWRAHPGNPLLVDSMGGRNGGLVVEGERLFRIGQCQSFERYGESLRVYEIKDLSPARYAEELVREIKPDFRRGVLGTHHLSTDGRVTAMDHAHGFFAA